MNTTPRFQYDYEGLDTGGSSLSDGNVRLRDLLFRMYNAGVLRDEWLKGDDKPKKPTTFEEAAESYLRIYNATSPEPQTEGKEPGEGIDQDLKGTV